MKTKLLLLSLLYFAYIPKPFAQVTTFQIWGIDNMKTLSFGNLSDARQTYDGGYIVIGSSPLLLKTDYKGDTIWTKYYYGGGGAGSDVFQTPDSGYLSIGGGLTKTNGAGDVLWAKNYGGVFLQGGSITYDNGYILTGLTDSFGVGGLDICLFKTDVDGNPVWSKTYGGTKDDRGYSVQQTSDSGYIILGSTTSFDSVGIYLIKTNTTGDTLWTKTYGLTINDFGNSVQQTLDGGYIIAGGKYPTDIYLIKIDSGGNLLWSKTYLTGMFAGSSYLEQLPDSGYIITGQVYILNSDSANVFLMKTDAYGNVLWNRRYGGPNDDDANSVHKTKDGGYIIGSSTTIEMGMWNSYGLRLIKTDSLGHSGCNEYDQSTTVQIPATITINPPTMVTSFNSTVTIPNITVTRTNESLSAQCLSTAVEEYSRISPKVYPNPVTPDGCISISLNEDMNGAEVTIFNILGEVLYSEVVDGAGQKILLQLKGKLSTGMYFVKIMQGEMMCVQKIVVMR